MFSVYPKCARLTLYRQIPTNTNEITQSHNDVPSYANPFDRSVSALAVIREHFPSLGPQEMELDSMAV